MAQGAKEQGIPKPIGGTELGRDQGQVIGSQRAAHDVVRARGQANSAAHCSPPSNLGRAILILIRRGADAEMPDRQPNEPLGGCPGARTACGTS
jgi:hypothetical protein